MHAGGRAQATLLQAFILLYAVMRLAVSPTKHHAGFIKRNNTASE